MKKNKIISIALTFALAMTTILGGTTSVFAVTSYPSDIMGTPLQVAVTNLIDRGIITGSNDGKFHPESPITRAELTLIMAKAANRSGELQAATQKNIFSDLAGYDWAKGYINICADAGIVNGVGDGKFAPAKNVSYAEFITLLIRVKNPTGGDAFPGEWPQNYITYAQMYNMMRDVMVNDWNASITRGEVAKLVYYNMPKGNSGNVSVILTPLVSTEKIMSDEIDFAAYATSSGTISYVWAVDGVDQPGNSGFFTYKMPDALRHNISVTVTNQQLGKNPVTTTVSAQIN